MIMIREAEGLLPLREAHLPHPCSRAENGVNRAATKRPEVFSGPSCAAYRLAARAAVLNPTGEEFKHGCQLVMVLPHASGLAPRVGSARSPTSLAVTVAAASARVACTWRCR